MKVEIDLQLVLLAAVLCCCLLLGFGQDPIENPGCFFPGAVPHSTVKDVGVGIGETLTFTCEPGFELIGEPDITCIANRTWSSDQLPICNHTGIFPELTTEPPTTTTASPHHRDIYRGCYFDNLQRALTDLITCADDGGACHGSCGETNRYCQSMDRMTLNLCRDLCRRRNLRYYALQSGNQCFCGGGLSDPFQHGMVDESQLNCSYPCSGNSSQTCGADFRMQVYEFAAHLPGSACFYPGYVQNSFAQHVENVPVGTTVSYICQPQHKITGDARITCQANGGWLPNTLPICNYTGSIEDPTTKSVTTMQNPTTSQAVTTATSTTTAQLLSRNTDLLPYIIGGVVLLLIFFTCLVGLYIYTNRRKRRENAGQNNNPPKSKSNVPSATGNPSSPPTNHLYETHISTPSEDHVYISTPSEDHVYHSVL